MRFEWDPAKAAANLQKHGISFTAAARAFTDPNRIDWLGDRVDYGEERWNSLCRNEMTVLAIVYTLRGDACRIISARKANRHEQEDYFGA